MSWTLYKMDGELKDSDLALRKTYLKTGDFKIMPEFSGRKVYTHKYGCDCYEVDGGFIVVEPIIGLGGGMGFFEDKAARVLWLKSDGAEKVLYRAADHWEALKPTGLLGQEIKNREMKLKEAGEEIVCPRWVSQTLLERAIQSWVPAYFTGSTTSTMAWPSSLVFLPTEHSNT